jgi:hypothetical protein
MIPSSVNPWENWNDYVTSVNRRGGEKCRIDEHFPGWLKAELNAALGRLRPADRGLVRLRFGLEDGEFWTLCQIGVAFGVSKARVQQRLAVVLGILAHGRSPSSTARLREGAARMRERYVASVGGGSGDNPSSVEVA